MFWEIPYMSTCPSLNVIKMAFDFKLEVPCFRFWSWFVRELVLLLTT